MQFVCWRRTCRYDVFSVMLLVLGVLYAFLVYWLSDTYQGRFSALHLYIR